MAALVLLAAAPAPYGPPTPAQMMADDRASAPRGHCDRSRSDAIVVCAEPTRPSPRLPLPDERAEAGEVVHHAGEASGDPGPPTGPRSRQKETVRKLFGLVKGAVTGEDTTPD